MSGTRRFAAALIALGAVAGPLLASPAASGQPLTITRSQEYSLDSLPLVVAVPGDRRAVDAQEAADQKIVLKAFKAMGKKRGPGLEPFLPELRAILARAPAIYPMIEKRDDGSVVIRSDDERVFIQFTLARGGGKRNFRTNSYIVAAYMLGWYANEVSRPDEALEPLARGLALQPGEPRLTSEQNIAMISLGRFSEALAANDAALAHPYLSPVFHGALLHNRAYLLAKLDRPQDAEAALNKLLLLQPGNQAAREMLNDLPGKQSGG